MCMQVWKGSAGGIRVCGQLTFKFKGFYVNIIFTIDLELSVKNMWVLIRSRQYQKIQMK